MGASTSQPARVREGKDVRFKNKHRGAAEAQAFVEIMRSVREASGWYDPEEILRLAKPPSSGIHKMFQWDDTIAGHLYRVGQCRDYIRDIRIDLVSRDGLKEIKFAVAHPEDGGYVNHVKDVLQKPRIRELYLEQALIDAERWMARYKCFKELNEVFSAIEALRKKVKG